jgi:glycosyltransferase involved in cell wall biosynthesis
MPLVSVIMPVKNGADFIEAAISSVLNQSFQDVELVVVDDQSDDRTREVLASIISPKIKVLSTAGSGGLVSALNLGIDSSSGKYLARLDSDDISHLHRFEKQVSVLDSSPATALCGTWARTFGSVNRQIRYPTTSAEIKSRMLFSNPFAHPSVMIRRQALDEAGLAYDQNYPVAEDFRLWAEISRHWEMANIPEELLLYRVHAGQVSERQSATRKKSVSALLESMLTWAGVELEPQELELHSEISFNAFLLGERPLMFSRIRSWFQKLENTNFTNNYSGAAMMKRETRFQMRRLLKFGAVAPVRRFRSLMEKGQ